MQPSTDAGGGGTPPRHLGSHPASGRMILFNMTAAIKKIGQEIGRSMAPLARNQQRVEDTLAYHKKKESKTKDLREFDLPKLKGWLHKRTMKDLQAFWRIVVNIDGWKNIEVCLLKIMKFWSNMIRHAIDPSIYKGKKYMEHVATAKMTVQLGRTLKDMISGQNLMGCIFRNRGEVK